jgi:hypothetical protein
MTASAGELSALVENEELGEVAYRRRLPEFLALPASEVAPVNLDVPIAVARAFGALAIARAHREELERRTKLISRCWKRSKTTRWRCTTCTRSTW